MMRVVILIAIAGVISACSSINPVSRNDSQITIKFDADAYDEAQAAAIKHCQRYGKTATHMGTTCPSEDRCMSNYQCYSPVLPR